MPALAPCCPGGYTQCLLGLRQGWASPTTGAWVTCPRAPAASLPFLNRGSPKLISAIYADYARSLKNLGFKQGALLFASKAGAAGRDLLNELEPPKQEPGEE